MILASIDANVKGEMRSSEFAALSLPPHHYFHTRKPKSLDLNTCTQQGLFSVSYIVLPDTLEKLETLIYFQVTENFQ